LSKKQIFQEKDGGILNGMGISTYPAGLVACCIDGLVMSPADFITWSNIKAPPLYMNARGVTWV
jgi:hypothetical protein